MPFYRDHLGMTLVNERHFPEAQFSLFFMATVPKGARAQAGGAVDSAAAG